MHGARAFRLINYTFPLKLKNESDWKMDVGIILFLAGKKLRSS